MKSVDIQNHIKNFFPRFTAKYYPSLLNIFCNNVTIQSFTENFGVITIVTTNPHNLVTGKQVVIANAFSAIQINSIERLNSFVTVTTNQPHYLSIGQNKVKIDGCIPVEYNGLFDIIEIIDNTKFVYQITTKPVTPATTNGQVLIQDFDNYNGVKTITVVNSNAFTYNLKYTNQTLGGIPMLIDTNVFAVSSFERARVFFTGRDTTKNALYVIVNSVENSINGIPLTDANQLVKRNESQPIEQITNFTIYASFIVQNEERAYQTKDYAMNEFAYLLIKTLCNIGFNSVYTEKTDSRTILTSHGSIDDITGKRYIHQYNFSTTGYLQYQDMFEGDEGVPWETVTLAFENKQKTFGLIGTENIIQNP